jgi:acyl-homoserine-lactone acylase
MKCVLSQLATAACAATLLSIAAGAAEAGTRGVPDQRQGSVNIYRDSYGMPHLYAVREEDAFFGLGYALGEDRLLQVLTWYVATRGELAAKFGRTPPPLPSADAFSGVDDKESPLHDSVQSDIAARKYMLLAKARRNLARLPRQLQNDLRSYIHGLSAYMRDHPERTPSWAPPLEPALPLALNHLQSSEQQFTCKASREADREASATRTSAEYSPTNLQFSLGASNAWAVAGSRTADGRVLMAADSHGSIEGYGTTFYPYRIKAGALDIVAFDRPGTLQFLFGHSRYFAWGLTEGPRYVADCYRIQVDPKSPRQFAYDGTIRTMTAVPYRVRVKGGDTVTGTFEYTHHNGVLSPVEERDGNVAYVVSYSYADRIGLGAGEGYRVATARTRDELEQALAQRDAYPANLIIGGGDGTIMYIRPGRIPIRPPGVDVRRTLDGNTSATAWRGIHPYSDLLKIINPPQGYISNSNISPDMMYPQPFLRPSDYPNYFAFEPGFTSARQQRLVELLDHATGMSVEDAAAIVMDETLTVSRPWGPAFAKVLADRPELLEGRPAELEPFLRELARFDGVFSKDSRGALYHEFLRRALHEHHAGEMDALQRAVEAAQLSLNQQNLLVQAAQEALNSMSARFGRLDLNWGDVHRVKRGDVDLPIGGGVLVGGAIVGGLLPAATAWQVAHLGVEPPARTAATLRALFFSTDPTTGVEYLVSGERIPFLVHFAADGVQSYAQTLWGVSDNPTSPHYADQCRLASDKILRPIPLSITSLERDHAMVPSPSLQAIPGRSPISDWPVTLRTSR